MKPEQDALAFAHTVMAQVGLPSRDPGDAVRIWNRTNGAISLRIAAGAAFHPRRGWVETGLPFGPKPRLILACLNAQALRSGSPEVDVEATLAGFTRRLGLDDGGRTTVTVRDQLARLATADMRLGLQLTEDTARTRRGNVVEEVEVWAPASSAERLLWPTHVRLARAYFDSLVAHAVPLSEPALRRLSGSAVALDAYAWLAQRLHRVPPRRPQTVPWEALAEQFGSGFARVRDFRRDFVGTLGAVCAAYPAAKVEDTDAGLVLCHSRPPISPRLVAAALPKPGQDRGNLGC